MLKLYRKTIIWSTLLSAFLLLVAYHIKNDTDVASYTFLQNCLIGIACSLLVVALTTRLQYLDEHAKVFYKYKRNLRKLYFKALYIQDSDISDFSMLELIGHRDSVDQCLEELKECMQNLCWFCPEKNRRYSKSFMAIYCVIADFYKEEYRNPQQALARLGENSVIELLEKLIKEYASGRVDNILVDGISKLRMSNIEKDIN